MEVKMEVEYDEIEDDERDILLEEMAWEEIMRNQGYDGPADSSDDFRGQ
jgi:hypothetical protein